jgi:penicillin-binding protein 2
VEKSSARLKVFALLVVMMFAALSTRLWFLQVLATQTYAHEAQNNSVRTAETDALRGNIYTADQYGKPHQKALVQNRPSLEVRINKQELDNSGQGDAVLLRLSDMLGISVKAIRRKLADTKYYDFQPKPIADFVPEDVRFYISEHSDEFPGVQVVDTSVRAYPMGTLGAHIVGSVGQINREQVDDPAYKNYGPNDLVGASGLELTYEKYLRGTKGEQRYVVNSDGETIRRLGNKEPTAGDDLVLALNSDVQQAAEQSLKEGIDRARTVFDEDHQKYFEAPGGAVVVLDPKTGGIVAMASYPSFDPRWYVDGLTQEQQRYLGYCQHCPAASKVAPLLDRAYQGGFVPGSTFKPFTALAAVKEGVASLSGSYDCPAEYTYPGDTSGAVFHNWSETDLPFMSVHDLLRISCDSAFYRWGGAFYYRYVQNQLGENNEPLQHDLHQWGFGAPTGVDLPGEASGFIPDAAWGDAKAQESIFPDGWTPGGDILTMIGSGYVKVTPLQLAQAYAALANDGHICQPHVVDRIVDSDGNTVKNVGGHCDRTLPYSKAELDYIMSALTDVPRSGTATSAFLGFPLDQYPVAGKTGTAFIGDTYQDTSWFAGMVPAGDPKYVVVAMVEQAGFGSDVAAPIVRRVIEQIYGIQPTGQVVTSAGQD